MKTTIAFIICLSLFTQQAYSLVDGNTWEAFKTNLNKKIIASDVLADFWYGDDGVDCGEPTFIITGINFEKNIVHLQIDQSGDLTYGCSKRSFTCNMHFSFENNSTLKLEPVDLIKDCEF